jgi:hypothetical protein
MAELVEFLSRIVISLNRCKIKYVIVGGVAAILRGRVRTTTDVDLIIENDESKFWNFLSELKQSDFEYSAEQAQYSLKENFNFSIFDSKSMMRIDLKLARSKFDLETLNSAEIALYQGIELKLASIPQLLIGKILYLGDVFEESDVDLLEYNDVLDFISIYKLFNENEKIDSKRLLDALPTEELKQTGLRLINLSKKY